jgi:acetyltransferase
MTPADVRRRFFAPITELGPALAHRLANPDPTHDVALAAVSPDGERFFGVGRLSGAHGIAEFAVAVRSNAQGRGIGSVLMDRLIGRARLLGLATIATCCATMIGCCSCAASSASRRTRTPATPRFYE